tara:strand:- start:6479 stop:7378 length:900 start_codon:yes stop_codon:yes gene_type:complete
MDCVNRWKNRGTEELGYLKETITVVAGNSMELNKLTRELIGKENVKPVDYGLDLVQDLRSGTRLVHTPIFFDEARLFLDNTKFKWPRTSIVLETVETPRTRVKAALVELLGMDGRATYKSVTDRLEQDLESKDSLFVSAMWEARKTRSNVRLSNKVDSGQVWWAAGINKPFKTQYEACKAWLRENYDGEAVNNSTEKRLKNMPNWCLDDAFRSPSDYADGAMRVDENKVIKGVGANVWYGHQDGTVTKTVANPNRITGTKKVKAQNKSAKQLVKDNQSARIAELESQLAAITAALGNLS